jgi:hypothetical protein
MTWPAVLFLVLAGCCGLVAVMTSWMMFLVVRGSRETEATLRRFEHEDRAEAEWAEALRVVFPEREGSDDGV